MPSWLYTGSTNNNLSNAIKKTMIVFKSQVIYGGLAVLSVFTDLKCIYTANCSIHLQE